MKKENSFEKTFHNKLDNYIIILCGITAIIIGVLSFFDFIPIILIKIPQTVIIAIGLLLLSQFSISNKINQTIHKLTPDKKKDDMVFEFPENIMEKIECATELNIYGLELYKRIDKYFNLLKTLSEKKIKIRVLLADPKGNVIDMIKLKFPNNNTSAPKNIKNAMGLLEELKKIKDSDIEVRKLDYLFPRNAFFINLQKDESVVFLSNYTFRLADKKEKKIFYKNLDNNYKFYIDEFNLMWEEGTEVL